MGKRRLLDIFRRYPKTAYSFGAIGVALLLILLNTVFQVQYYRGRALPNTVIGGLDVGNKTQGEIGYALLENNQSAKLTIDTGASAREVTYYEAGLSPDLAYMSQVAVSRPWWHLTIPTAILGRIHTYELPYAYAIDTAKVTELVNAINETDSRAPLDAKFDLTNGTPVIVPAQVGTTYEASTIVDTMLNAPFQPGVTLRLNPAAVTPAITEESFEPVKAAAQSILAAPPEIIANGQRLAIPPETLASWITTTENAVAGYTLAYKSDDIQKYVDSLNEQYFIPAQAGSVSLVDGTEVSRTGGVAGSGIDSTAAVQAIIDGLNANQAVITLPLSRIDAKYAVSRTYSNSDSGLRALIGDLVQEKGDYAISIHEFGGQGRTANVKGDNVYLAASTYKLYIALHALQQAEAGALDFAAPFAGISVGRCFDLMIDHSDNYCANSFINEFSRTALTDSMQAQGFSKTAFTEDGIFTSANDLTGFLVALESGNIVSSENRDKLLSLMKKQIYRNGIPTGASDSTVANKVGYFGGYRHDAGIVYGPNSTYAISIVSYGGSYPQIVDITRRVHAFMQQ